MSDSPIKHRSIGDASREVEQEERAKVEKRRALVDKYTKLPGYRLAMDQLSVWAVWLTLAASAFVFCTVAVAALAIKLVA